MQLLEASKRNILARNNEKLIHQVAHRMSQVCREPYDDLFQIGYIGLIKACDRFDPATGNAFSSFAIPYILGEIQHYLRDQWQSIKIPRTDIETKAKVRRLQRHLAGLGRDVSVAEVALGLGISESKWRELEAIDSNVTISLDELLHEPAQADQDLCNIDVIKHLNKLEVRTRNAIAERFFSDISIKDIAKRQKATPEKIKASINLGLTKLRISLSKELC